MIKIEADQYENQTRKPGGWAGWRPFIVEKKVKESDEVTSFYLYPADKGEVVSHIPGQFISLTIFLPELGLNQARQYSISSSPSKRYYRISVKRERGIQLNTNGIISNHLHDYVEVGNKVNLTAPTGNFVLPEEIETPVMLISGGIGSTPLMSMLHQLTEKGHSQPITWIHACRNRSVHAFKEQVDFLADNRPNIQKYIFYDSLTEKDLKEGIMEGPPELNHISSLPKTNDTHYFICGPAGFIQKQHQELLAMGINKETVFYEEFGPQLLQLN